MGIESITKNDKIFLLAYDQGFEHGPDDFNDYNYHPNFIFKIALQAGVSCVALHYGLAKRFYTKEISKKLPLVLKLNGKTNLYSGNVRSALVADAEDAKRLGAVGIGYTIYPGQVDEHIEFEKFAIIRRQAEKLGLFTILWAYARGPEIKENPESKGNDQYDVNVVGHAVRVASELGADAVKVKYTGTVESFADAAKMSAGMRVIVSGTSNFSGDYLQQVGGIMKAGVDGIAVGRKVWQDKDPVHMAKQLAAKIYNYDAK